MYNYYRYRLTVLERTYMKILVLNHNMPKMRRGGCVGSPITCVSYINGTYVYTIFDTRAPKEISK